VEFLAIPGISLVGDVVTDPDYVVRPLPAEADQAPVIRMRRDWVGSAASGVVPPPGTSPADGDPTYPERFRRWWAREADSRRTWLVWHRADAVGMANVKIFERMPRPGSAPSRWAYVANVWVDPPHRRRGVGTALLHEIVDWAREEAMVRLVLSPSEESLGIYRAVGFRPAGDLLRLDLDPEG
jgi:GNAT superfamily N-acetyltransferase